MADTTYVDGQQPLIYAAWLNDINNVVYRVLGSGGAVPTTVAQLLANLGLTGTVTVGGNNSFTGTNSFAGPTTFTGAATFNDTVTHEGTETFNVGSVLNLLGSLNVSGLASFTGTVALGGGATATTAAVGTSTTQVATTEFVNQYPALVNNTSASSDISLAVGQGCYIDVVGATTVPLHVATGDNQEYEISGALEGQTGSSDSAFLLPNNAAITNMFYFCGVDSMNGSLGALNGYVNGFLIGYVADIRKFKASVSTKTVSKAVLSNCIGKYPTGNALFSSFGSIWLSTASDDSTSDTTTLWTSLGTLTFPVAVTGRIITRRIA